MSNALFSAAEAELFGALVAVANSPKQVVEERARALARIRELAPMLVPPNYCPMWEPLDAAAIDPEMPVQRNLLRPELAERFVQAFLRMEEYERERAEEERQRCVSRSKD